MLNIEKTVDGSKATFAITGRLDTNTASELQKSLDESFEDLTELTFDCEGLDYVSSAGLRVFLAAQKTMSAQGEMKLINVSESIRDIFDVTGFSQVFTIE